ncbi:hypothetical protein ACOTVS_11075 [Aliarcobacter butzleri]
MRDKIMNKDDWQLNPYSSEWAKRITQPESCKGKGGIHAKIQDVITISTNVIRERPDVWLNGKYLEFVNSKCSLIGTYTLRDTTKAHFDSTVNDHFKVKNNNKYNSLGAGIFCVFILYFVLGYVFIGSKGLGDGIFGVFNFIVLVISLPKLIFQRIIDYYNYLKIILKK